MSQTRHLAAILAISGMRLATGDTTMTQTHRLAAIRAAAVAMHLGSGRVVWSQL